MSKKIVIPFLISIVCFAAINSVAQHRDNQIKPYQYRAIHWSMADGLPNDLTIVVLKDAKGFLWVGSGLGELSRFDGANFKNYIPDKNKRGAINSGSIWAFIEDSLNNIWIGTGEGLSRYDLKADTFTNLSPILDSSSSYTITFPFWATKEEVFCFEPGLWITAYNVRSLTRKKLVKLSIEDSEMLNFQTSYSVFDSASNSIWMLPLNEHGLVQISLHNSKKQHFLWSCSKNSPNHTKDSEAMCLDRKRNSIWINSPDGLMEFSLTNKRFQHINAFNEFVKLKNYDRFIGIDLDKYGRVWLATKPKGILIYDPATKLVRQVFSDPVLQQKTGNSNLHIYCDRDGIVWTSYFLQGGMYELLPYNPPFIQYTANPKKQGTLSNNSILTIVPAADGQIWLGTLDGLNIFDPVTEKFNVLKEKNLVGVKGKAVVLLHIDTIRQKAWLISGSGSQDPKQIYKRGLYKMDMYEMDIKTRKCRPIVLRNGTKRLDSLDIEPAWIRYFKKGFLLCDDKHGIFEINGDSLFADLVIPSKETISRVELVDDRFLFLKKFRKIGKLTVNFTFENQNGEWVRISHLVDSLEWQSMLYNKKDQTYWVSFKYELVHYDKEFRKIKSYNRDDGYNGIINKMLIDNAGNIWFTNTLNQVSRLNTASGTFTTLSDAEGFQKQDYTWSAPAAKDAHGNLYFAGGILVAESGGMHRILPERYLFVDTPNVYLRSLTINQKSISLATGVNNLEKLSLRYNQNTISIETGIIDFYSKGKGQLRYKLEGNGKDENWQYGPAYYTLRYEGLPPGSYRLVMQASNSGNEFNTPEKILTIIISPPFWQTWWFRILAAVFFIAIVYAIIQYRSRNLKQQNIMLEEKVMVRTRELKHSLEDLKATQTQLIQSEKMASLGELTAGIAHEIQNPLNFVNNFSEVNSELLQELKNEIQADNKQEALLLSDDIATNEQKINHHGKRADAIVKGMLQHSHNNTGQKEPSDINKLADEYLRLCYNSFSAKNKSFNATIKTDFDYTIAKINIVPQEIGRVILNLLNNAFYSVAEKKKEQGESFEPIVLISTKKIEGKIEIKITDNGKGILQKILDKIFQPFFTTKPTGQGTGLGLSLAHDIITKGHGGELKVETKEGEGSEFIILLHA